MIAPFSSWREYHLLVSLPELLSAAEIPFPPQGKGKRGGERERGPFSGSSAFRIFAKF